jgi:hypothetical protein
MFPTGTLGEKKANVKRDFSFALLSPQPSSGAKTRGDIPTKESQHAASPRGILARSSSLIARRALDHHPGNLGILASIHAGIPRRVLASFQVRHIVARFCLPRPCASQCDILYVSALGGLPQMPSFHRTASSLIEPHSPG